MRHNLGLPDMPTVHYDSFGAHVTPFAWILGFGALVAVIILVCARAFQEATWSKTFDSVGGVCAGVLAVAAIVAFFFSLVVSSAANQHAYAAAREKWANTFVAAVHDQYGIDITAEDAEALDAGRKVHVLVGDRVLEVQKTTLVNNESVLTAGGRLLKPETSR